MIPRRFLVVAQIILAATWPAGSQTPSEGIKRSELRSPKFTPYGTVHVLSIGINHYEDRSWPPLEFAEADATAVAKALRERYGYKSGRVILGTQATKLAILNALNEFRATIGTDDVLLVFFAGHGQSVGPIKQRRGFLIPADVRIARTETSLENWNSQALDMQQVAEIVRELPCRHVLVLVDACYSGLFGASARGGGRLTDRIDLNMVLSEKSRLVLTAGTEDQRSWEGGKRNGDTPLQHGWFTTALLESLRTDSAFSARDLALAVRRKVGDLSKGSMQPMLRELAPEWHGEFVFMPSQLPQRAVDFSAAITGGGSRGLRATTAKDILELNFADNYRFSESPQETEQYWKEQIANLKDNATLGSSLAKAALYIAYVEGKVVKADAKEAYKWAKEAYYDDQHGEGSYVLGLCYRDGIGVPANPLASLELRKQAVEAMFPMAIMDQSAGILGDKNATSADINDAVSKLQQLSKAGYPWADFILSYAYNGRRPGIPEDRSKALDLVRSAATAGVTNAQVDLFDMLCCGLDGYKRDTAEALGWLMKAVKAGNPKAQRQLGVLFLPLDRRNQVGPPFAINADSAVQYLQLAAAQHDPPAHLLLYDVYHLGLGGMQKNPKLAKQHLEAAVALNYSEAIRGQGLAYEEGIIYPKDIEKAVQLLQQAAAMGDPNAKKDYERIRLEQRWKSSGR